MSPDLAQICGRGGDIALVGPSAAKAEKCSCIFGIPAIHGSQGGSRAVMDDEKRVSPK